MNNDMATLIMCSQKIFEHWNDSVSNEMNNNCILSIQQKYNIYINEMNTRMNIYMRAEKQISDEFARYEQKLK